MLLPSVISVVLCLQLHAVSAASSSSVAAVSYILTPSQSAATNANTNGLCPEFISECFSICFASARKYGLGQCNPAQCQIAHACTYSIDGYYSLACHCGQQDDTAAVLAALPSPLPTVTATYSKTTTSIVSTLTSLATTLTTVPFTTGTTVSTCSPVTVVNTITAINPTTTTRTTTIVSTSTTTFVATIGAAESTISAAILATPSPGSNGKRDSSYEVGVEKRSSAFCDLFVLACMWGCGIEGSVPRYDLCQAAAHGTATAACVCRNGDNLLQQALAIFNSGKSSSGKCSSLSGTRVVATATVTSTVISTALATSLRVVTTIGTITTTQVLTSTVIYACPATMSTTITIPTTISADATILSTTTTTFTTVTVIPTSYSISVGSGGGTGTVFIGAGSSASIYPAPTNDAAGAAVFVPVLNQAAGETQYNLLALNGPYAGQSLSMEGDDSLSSNPDYYGVLAFAPVLPQGPTGGQDADSFHYESAVWLIDQQSLMLSCSFILSNGMPLALDSILFKRTVYGEDDIFFSTAYPTDFENTIGYGSPAGGGPVTLQLISAF